MHTWSDKRIHIHAMSSYNKALMKKRLLKNTINKKTRSPNPPPNKITNQIPEYLSAVSTVYNEIMKSS